MTYQSRRRSSRRSSRRKNSNEGGQVAVESALIAPLLFFIIFIIVEAGPMFLLWSSNKSAAQEGARAATISGNDSEADYDMLRSMVPSLDPVGSRLDYIIIFRAKDLHAKVPPQCVAQAQAHLSDPITKPVGIFKYGTYELKTDDPVPGSGSGFATFGWATVRPDVACNVYRRGSWTQRGRFTYDANSATPSLDRFWPAALRNNTAAAGIVRQDYVGIYVQSRYSSMTGIINSRAISHTYIGQLEARRTG